MFVIDEVVEQSYVRVCERLKLLEKKVIQRPSSTLKVQCCRRVGELKCLLVGAEGGLHIYLEDEEAVSWLTCVAKVCCNLIRSVSLIVPCCVLYWFVMCCVVLCCVVMFCDMLYQIVLRCVVLLICLLTYPIITLLFVCCLSFLSWLLSYSPLAYTKIYIFHILSYSTSFLIISSHLLPYYHILSSLSLLFFFCFFSVLFKL